MTELTYREARVLILVNENPGISMESLTHKAYSNQTALKRVQSICDTLLEADYICLTEIRENTYILPTSAGIDYIENARKPAPPLIL